MRKFMIGFAIGIAIWFASEWFKAVQEDEPAEIDSGDTATAVDTIDPEFQSDEAESLRLEYINSLKDDSAARLAPIWDSTFDGLDGTADSVSMEIKFRETDSVWERNRQEFEAGGD